MQQRFVSDVSHELRTPLTTIRMAADVVYDDRDAAGSHPRRAPPSSSRTSSTGSRHCSSTCWRSPASTRAPQCSTSSGSTSSASCSGRSRRPARWPNAHGVRGADVARRARAVHDRVRSPTGRTASCATSSSNAIEHGDVRGVDVLVADSDEAVAVIVRDYGVGLRPGESALVFNRFWRADPARARTTGGTGLGLAISLEDARLHGGWLEAWGEPGKGACFRLTLPRDRSSGLRRVTTAAAASRTGPGRSSCRRSSSDNALTTTSPAATFVIKSGKQSS